MALQNAYFGNSRLGMHISMNFDSISTAVFSTAYQLLSDKETAIYFHVLGGFNFEMASSLGFTYQMKKGKQRREKLERKRETKEEMNMKNK